MTDLPPRYPGDQIDNGIGGDYRDEYGDEFDREHVERIATGATDSGQVETLEDGSLSIPVFEEQLVIEKRLVVRERIIVRKHRVTEEQLVEADLRRERVEIEADESIVDQLQSNS